MGAPVIHWEIGATDAAGLVGFYREMFDWRVAPSGPEYFLVTGDEGGIGGGILQVSAGVPPYLTVYVQVADLEPALQRALGLGATEVVPPMTIPEAGRFAMFADPQGHTVGLLEPSATVADDAGSLTAGR